MNIDFYTILLAFIEGFALIISPCILPILPIILAGSLSGSKKRPLGIILGFTFSFAIVAFFSRQFVHYLSIDLNTLRQFSYVILFLLGLVMLSSYLSEKFSQLTQGLVSKISFLAKPNPSGGFLSGLFIGALIAIVWTPCAGPILAAVIVQTVLQKTTNSTFFVLLAFAFGVALPMYLLAFFGKKLVFTFNFFKKRTNFFRKLLGAILIITVTYLVYSENDLFLSQTPQTTIKTAKALQDGLWSPYKAPQIEGIEAWINSPPLQINELKGKVVLIDFWAYSCINCIRTLPYLKSWYKKYKNSGLVIIGIHSPEFDFEKDLKNVKSAVERYGLLYPVALDNRFLTWINFKNKYWPAHYLINKEGEVVYTHFGEGSYDVTENNIRFLLGIDDLTTVEPGESPPLSFSQTPETYLGYARADRTFSPYLHHDKAVLYNFPTHLPINAWGLQGVWQVKEDKIVAAKANAALKIHFNAARKVFIVMGANNKKPIKLQLLLNGQKLEQGKGKDVKSSAVLVDKHALYELVALKEPDSGLLEIIATQPGVEIYTFTFGN